MTEDIQEFVYWGSWFEKKYMEKLSVRYFTFKIALNFFLQKNGKNIVETGSLRSIGHGWKGDGNATILLGEIAQKYDKHLWTVDIDSEVTEVARKGTKEYKDSITYVNQDSLVFFQEFKKEIDLLYLDSYDCPPEEDASQAQQHNLEELQTAFPKLSASAIILLDDNWFENGGKTKLSKQFLSSQGWICVFEQQQTDSVDTEVREKN